MTIKNPNEVAHFIAAGKDSNDANGSNRFDWLVTKVADGKPLRETSAMVAAIAAGGEKCKTQAGVAAASMLRSLQALIDKAHVLHDDHRNLDNVFFSDDLSRAVFIDFGEAKRDRTEVNCISI